MITIAVLLGLGVFALVNLTKLFVPIRLLGAAKLLMALILSALAVIPFVVDVQNGLLLASGVFGLSTIFHGLHKLLEASGDERRMTTISRGRARRS